MNDKITFEEFKKVEIRIGKIIKCEKVENAEMDELFTFIGDKKTGSTSSPS